MKTKVAQLFINIILVSLVLFASIPVMASEPIQVKIPVSCFAEGIDDGFTYTITPSDGAPAPQISVISLKDGETGNFEISYTDPNTWHYEIKENTDVSGNPEIKYDTTVYKAIVFIGVKNDGTLYSELSIVKEGSTEKSAACDFRNLTGSREKDTEKDSEKESKKKSKTESDSTTQTSRKTTDNNNTGSENNRTKNTANNSAGNPSSNVNTPNVQTGDENNPLLHLFIMISAFVMIAGCNLVKKRGRKNA